MAILKQAEAGSTVPDLCREHGVSAAQLYKWRAKFGGMDVSMMTRMKKLKDEKKRLKKMHIEAQIQANIRPQHFIEWRGKSKRIRSDNGPEYISHLLKNWAEQ